MAAKTKIAVVGSRDFDDYGLFEGIMDAFLGEYEHVAFVSGGAKGTDEVLP